MVVSLGVLSRRIRRWKRNHVYCMYHFRLLYEQATRDHQIEKQVQHKINHLQNKVEQHMTYGETLGLKDAQMREFNLAIIDEMRKGKSPKAIIQALIKHGQEE